MHFAMPIKIHIYLQALFFAYTSTHVATDRHMDECLPVRVGKKFVHAPAYTALVTDFNFVPHRMKMH